MSDYRPTRLGELFFLQIGDRKQKTLMRVTEIDGENFRSTSAGVDDAVASKNSWKKNAREAGLPEIRR